MYCTKCGKQNTDDSKFCIYCGSTFINANSGQIGQHTTGQLDKTNYIQVSDRTQNIGFQQFNAAAGEVASSTADMGYTPQSLPVLNNVNPVNVKPVKKISTKLIVWASIIVVVAAAFVVFRTQALGGSCYAIAQVMHVFKSESSLDMAKQAVEYDNVEAYRKFVNSLYVDKAIPYIESDPSSALDYLLQANDYFEDKNTSDLLGKAYINKADKKVDSDPDEAVSILSSAKKYTTDDTIKPVLQKAAEKIILKNSSGAKVLGVSLSDLNGDGKDEIVGLYNNTVEVYTNSKEKFSPAGKSNVDLSNYKSMEFSSVTGTKGNQIIIKSKSSSSTSTSDCDKLDILTYTNNNLLIVFSGRGNISIDISGSTSGAKNIVLKNKENDFEKHVVERTYKWSGTIFMPDSLNVTYESGSFVYPQNPSELAICYLQALALGMDAEVSAMTYTTTNRYDDLLYDTRNVDYLQSTVNKGDIIQILDNSYGGSDSYKFDEQYYIIDFTKNGTSHTVKIYLVKPGDSSNWQVYGGSDWS